MTARTGRLPQLYLGRGGRALGALPRNGVSQQQEAGPLFLPQLNTLVYQASPRGEDVSNAAPTIPTQHRQTHQILNHWQPFWDLKRTFAVSRRAEQLRLRAQQRIVTTAEDSVLRTEMAGLESQEEDAPRRNLWFKPMSWLGQIRPHPRLGMRPCLLVSGRPFFLPRPLEPTFRSLVEVPLSACGCRKFQIDALGTTSAHLPPTRMSRRLDWEADQIADLFRTTHNVKT